MTDLTACKIAKNSTKKNTRGALVLATNPIYAISKTKFKTINLVINHSESSGQNPIEAILHVGNFIFPELFM